uniref:Lipase n=1 Tax=Pinus tabuliformis TaxID=88731 RepID=A0A0K0M6Z3_PINTB|nr:LIP1 [Pinus tabuliformis]
MGGWTLMEMWKILFGLLFTRWPSCGIRMDTNTGAPDGLCSTFVEPYYSKYDCHEYSTVTPDGFRLGLQRINSRSDSGQKGPLLLNHGVLNGGDAWVLNSPDEFDVSPAFVLADAGYDVWIGNARTTRYSYGHEKLTEEDEAYWDWSFDELAAFDLPSMMYLVHNVTNKKIHYIGHSQGTQSALAALSEGKLIDIVNKVALLAPVAYDSHIWTPLLAGAAVLHLDQLVKMLGFNKFSTKTPQGKQYVDLICQEGNLDCDKDYVTAFTGTNCCFNYSKFPFYDQYETQSTSTKNLVHLAQLYRADKFQKYDYGAAENNQRYNSIYPPAYDLSKVPTQNLLLVYGGLDPLADLVDVQRLKNELSPGYKYLFKPNFAHLDFIVANNCKQQLYDEVMAFFEDEQNMGITFFENLASNGDTGMQ